MEPSSSGAPDVEPVSFLGRPVPVGFTRRTVALAPGEARPIIEAEWRDTVVTVERGEIELECLRGGRRRFVAGDLLWFTGLSLRLVRNPTRFPVVLSAVRRHPRRRVGAREGAG